MPNDHNAPFFELGYARLLSHRLRSRSNGPSATRTGAVEPVSGQRGFTRLSRQRAQLVRAPFDAAGLGDALRRVHDAWGAPAWHALLDACLRISGGSGAFVMDPQGLMIAARGDVEPELAERLGGRLMLALDQAEKMSALSGGVSVELGGPWLTGVRATSGSTAAVTLGVLANEPLSAAARTAITELVGSIGAEPKQAGA